MFIIYTYIHGKKVEKGKWLGTATWTFKHTCRANRCGKLTCMYLPSFYRRKAIVSKKYAHEEWGETDTKRTSKYSVTYLGGTHLSHWEQIGAFSLFVVRVSRG